MPTHLSAHLIDGYRRRSLSPAELLEVDDHLAECPGCRRLLAEGETLTGAFGVWEELAEGGGSGEERLAVGIDLGALADEAARRDGRRWIGARRPLLVALCAAGVLLGAGLIAWLATLPLRREVESLRTEVRTMRHGAPPPAPGPQAAGLEALPAGLRQEVAAALRDRRLERPAGIADLIVAGSVLRGLARSSEFALGSPLGTAVIDGRPTFRWSALPGARSYQVRVFDRDFNPVAQSGSLSSKGTEWTPGEPLAAGRVYAWQVAAHRGSEELMAPGPSSPQALFRVLPETQAAAVRSAAREAGSSHLALGVVYAHAGLCDDAERELGAAAREGPEPEAARELLASVEGWRGPSQPSQSPRPTSTNAAQ
ncbi:MAG TPA: zf-HC2 domain-containing protein [Thermoanaerobaculia bacterium]|nr:zf-HC2 domain-containing protein [Thermoanaerobaculia bacterium]